MTVFDQIVPAGVVPVVVIDDEAHAPAVGEALLAGGLGCAEITFRTAAAAGAIGAMVRAVPEMLVGAGSVVTVAQAEEAAAAGARFVVCPGFDETVVAWCEEAGLPVLPGVMTPSEITRAVRAGFQLVKYFPAEAAGGAAALEAIGSVFGGVRFVPTGGIGPGNLAEYLRLPMVAACGGSWLASRRLIAEGAFGTITRLTAAAVAIVREVRDGSRGGWA